MPVGEQGFTCEPPSEVVRVELSDAARDELEQRGRLKVIARIGEQEERLTIRPDEP